MTETTNHCDACGLDYFYAPNLHVCRTAPVVRGTSWVEECMAKQRSTHDIKRTS